MPIPPLSTELQHIPLYGLWTNSSLLSMPAYENKALGNMTDGSVAEAPQFLPTKFTDESILTIPIPYSGIYPASSIPGGNESTPGKRKGSFLGRFTNGSKKKREGFKMVKMTRREYLMYWAKDEEGRYVGTEPEGRGREVFGERLM